MEKTYYIVIDGERIFVSEDVYYAYKRPEWREAKRQEVRSDRESSLAVVDKDGDFIPSDDPLVEEIVTDKLLLELLMSKLNDIAEDERSLIDALFFAEKSERELSKETGIPHPTIHVRKNALLKKLRRLLEE